MAVGEGNNRSKIVFYCSPFALGDSCRFLCYLLHNKMAYVILVNEQMSERLNE